MILDVPEKFAQLRQWASTYLNAMASELDLTDLVLIVFQGRSGALWDIVASTHEHAVTRARETDRGELADEIAAAREPGCITYALCANDGTGLVCKVQVDKVNASGGSA